MHKPVTVLEIKTHKFLCDFEIQMSHPIVNEKKLS